MIVSGGKTVAAFLDAGLIDALIARLKKYDNDSAKASLIMSALKLMTSGKARPFELGRLVGQDGLAHDFKAAQACDAGRRGAVVVQARAMTEAPSARMISLSGNACMMPLMECHSERQAPARLHAAYLRGTILHHLA